jgi:hypothetical protein
MLAAVNLCAVEQSCLQPPDLRHRAAEAEMSITAVTSMHTDAASCILQLTHLRRCAAEAEMSMPSYSTSSSGDAAATSMASCPSASASAAGPSAARA